MLTVADAFVKFRGRQELTTREQEDVSRRHREVRDCIGAGLQIERDFLTGSYARWTKTKPLKDVDVFFALGADERGYRDKSPHEVLERFRAILAGKYGVGAVHIDRMAVTVNFGVSVDIDDSTDDKVMSIDAVPAFTSGDHYEIPDERNGVWIQTNPEEHARLAVAAHAAYAQEWKPLVRMLKKWNQQAGGPVMPSFLVEVMALRLLDPPFAGGYPYEVKGFFAGAAASIHDRWADPAGLGPDVSAVMTSSQKDVARMALLSAEAAVNVAMLHERSGRGEQSLRSWRDLFGPQFPLS